MFFLILATLMIPRFVNIFPFYVNMVKLRWINTYLPLFVPQMANASGIYLMNEYIERLVPNDLINAGQIDWLNHFQVLLWVVFPSVQPGYRHYRYRGRHQQLERIHAVTACTPQG
ncbi:MAG: carbohydrate ABC transporter permease [Spirochaetales bacterium]|nr:carbohydrate ABC transporter permease [Spirochaetales bacterium]